MALVDYSSDSGSDEEEGESGGGAGEKAELSQGTSRQHSSSTPAAKPSSLPSLPASFHDLYASTVRATTTDDPALHHGRTRQIPHVAGNWPSHIYVEWFPTAEECELLTSLLSELRLELWDNEVASTGSAELHSSLTSDLATPLPLHISLSRPFVLTTDEKDDFLERLSTAFRQQSSVNQLSVRPHVLAWHKSPDSNRAFLVLRVQENEGGNAGLTSLLSVCNTVVRQFGQPALYSSGDDGAGEETKSVSAATVLDRFHISIAWSLAEITEELSSLTAAIFERDGTGFWDRIGAMEVPVHCVKVKIGNVVTSLALPDGSRREQAPPSTLFGQ